jgi:hypothetical protein
LLAVTDVSTRALLKLQPVKSIARLLQRARRDFDGENLR